jgi:hypothetical protein
MRRRATVPSPFLAHAAVRFSRDPFFLGYLLLAAQAHHGWSAADLRAHLGVDEDGLVDLALCRAPAGPPTPAYTARLAGRWGLDEERLAGIIRAGQAAERHG